MNDGLLAQSARILSGRGNGRATGKVSAPDGTPIEGALVTMLFQDKITKFEATTDKKGKWRVMGLGKGQFMIKVQKDGYLDLEVLRDISGINRNEPVIVTLQIAEKIILPG